MTLPTGDANAPPAGRSAQRPRGEAAARKPRPPRRGREGRGRRWHRPAAGASVLGHADGARRRVAAGRRGRQHPGHDRDDGSHRPGRLGRRGRPRLARHDPQGLRLDLWILLGGRRRRNTPGLLPRFRPGRRRVPAAHPHGAVPRGRGAQRPGLAAARPGVRRGAGPAPRLQPRPAGQPGGDPSGIALPVMRDGQVIGTMDFFAMDAVEVSPTRLEALRTIGLLASDKIVEAGQAARADPDQADGREREGQHDVRGPRPEDPVHEPAGRADAQEAGSPPAGEGRPDDRPVDRRLPQGARAPAAAAGRPAQLAADRRPSASAPSSSSCRSARWSIRTAATSAR